MTESVSAFSEELIPVDLDSRVRKCFRPATFHYGGIGRR